MPQNAIQPIGFPAEVSDRIKRITLTGRVMILNVLTGQLCGDVRIRADTIRVAAAKVSGSWMRTHSIFGPTA